MTDISTLFELIQAVLQLWFNTVPKLTKLEQVLSFIFLIVVLVWGMLVWYLILNPGSIIPVHNALCTATGLCATLSIQ